MVNGDARIWASCTYDLPSSTAVRCTTEKADGKGYRVSLVFGDGTMQGEVVMDMPESVVGVLLTQVKGAVKEIWQARQAAGGEVFECVPDL